MTTATVACSATTIVPSAVRDQSRALPTALGHSFPGEPGSAGRAADPGGLGSAPAPRWAPAALLVGAVLAESWVAVPYASEPVLLLGLLGLLLVGGLLGPRKPDRVRPPDVDVHGPLASLHREATTGRWAA